MAGTDETNHVAQTEAIKTFNEFQSQSRSRVESTAKLVLIVSGSMLTISVGAVLSDRPAHIPSELIPYLKNAWIALFYSIASALVLIVLMVISTYHMGRKWAKVLANEDQGGSHTMIHTWPLLEITNWIAGLTSAISCLAGIALTAYVAIGVASG